MPTNTTKDFVAKGLGFTVCADGIVKRMVRRTQGTKHKLEKLLGAAFNPELSEDQNMTNARFVKVYDAGHLVFTLDR